MEPGRHGARGPGVRDPGPAADGGGLAGGRGALREAVGERPHRALGAQHGPHLHHAHQQPPVRRLRLPAPGAVPGRRRRDALGPHLRDPAAVQPELSARARLRDGLGVRRGLPHPGCTGRRAVEVPEGREDGLRRLPGPAQKVPAPRGRPGPRKASRRHARVSVRGGQGPRGPVPDPPNRGQVSLLQHGELEGRGRPRAPLPRRRRPAADGLSGHRRS